MTLFTNTNQDTPMFESNSIGSRLFAAAFALVISSLVMAFAIVPGSPAGVIA